MVLLNPSRRNLLMAQKVCKQWHHIINSGEAPAILERLFLKPKNISRRERRIEDVEVNELIVWKFGLKVELAQESDDPTQWPPICIVTPDHWDLQFQYEEEWVTTPWRAQLANVGNRSCPLGLPNWYNLMKPEIGGITQRPRSFQPSWKRMYLTQPPSQCVYFTTVMTYGHPPCFGWLSRLEGVTMDQIKEVVKAMAPFDAEVDEETSAILGSLLGQFSNLAILD